MKVGFPLRLEMDAQKMLKIARENDLKAIEILISERTDFEFFNNIKKDLADFEITAHYSIRSHAAELFFSENLMRRRAGMNLLIEMLPYYRALNAQLYIIHPGRTFSPITEMEEIRDACIQNGMKMCLENSSSGEYADITKVANLCRTLKVGLTLDIGHLFMNKQPIDNFKDLQDIVEHVHLHDVDDKQDHVRLGGGFVPLPKVVQGLKEIKYDKSIILETHHDPTFPDSLVESKKMLDVMWENI